MTDGISSQHESPGSRAENKAFAMEVEFNLAEIVLRLARAYRLILGLTVTGLLAGIAAAMLATPYYTGEAIFLPPKTSDTSASALFGASDDSDLYLGMLGSRTVQDDLIDRLGLVQRFKAKNRTQARILLSGMTKTSVSKNQLIVVDVTSTDPKLAAAVANEYLDSLYRLNGKMVASASDHRRAFFEAQLEEQKEALTEAERALAQTQRETGVSPAGEVQAGLNATASLQSQIDSAEARMAGLLTSETEQAPDVVTARSQLAQLRAELARQQSDIPGARRSGLASNASLPQLSFEYAQKARDVKVREAAFDALMTQYEKARLASIDPGPQFQIVDRAVVPEQKSGPSRKLFTLVGFALGLGLALAIVLLGRPALSLAAFLRTAASGKAGPSASVRPPDEGRAGGV